MLQSVYNLLTQRSVIRPQSTDGAIRDEASKASRDWLPGFDHLLTRDELVLHIKKPHLIRN